jgi:hypothetical protein
MSDDEKNEDIKNNDEVLKRTAIINAWVSLSQEINKIIITLSSGAIGIFALQTNFKADKTLFKIALISFSLSVLTSLFSLILSKKNLLDLWHNNPSIGIGYLVNLLDISTLWLFLIGIIMIGILVFNSIGI